MGFKLNQAQLEAVQYTKGPCLVLAGAGSGKTRVITSKIVNLQRNYQIPPFRICALTFTNKAAGEMRERTALELGAETASKIWISTFHSLGLELLKLEHRAAGLPKNFTLFDEHDVNRVLKEILRTQFSSLLTGSSSKDALERSKTLIANWKTRLLAPDEVDSNSVFSEVYAAYDAYLNACQCVDFEDLIYLPTRLLLNNDKLREKWQSCFFYVLVDEYQDTNETQYQLLKILTGGARSFTVVGDDDQSIYSWRGAKPQNLKTLSIDFPDLKVIKLEQNYRSSGRILNCANTLIANNPHLYEKTLFSEHPLGSKITVVRCADEECEALRITSEIKAGHFQEKAPWSSFAVLYRSNFQSRFLEKCLFEEGIPFLISGGTSFFDLQEIKDIMAYCRLISNLKDNAAFLRIINVPRRGIGEHTIKIIAETASKSGTSNFEACLNPVLVDKLLPAQHRSVNEFMFLITKLRQMLLNRKDSYLAENLVGLIGYERYLRSNSETRSAAVEYKLKNVNTFMDWILDMIRGRHGQDPLSFAHAVEKMGLKELQDRKNSTDNDDAVQLMTLHSSKGLEFPSVFLMGMEENILPHKESLETGSEGGGLEEERRLAYVGITRAQKKLMITWCKKRKRYSTDIYPQMSRFIKEMAQEDLLYFEEEDLPEESEQKRAGNLNSAADFLKELAGSFR